MARHGAAQLLGRCWPRTTTAPRWSAASAAASCSSRRAQPGRGGRITTYGGTKAFDLVFAEGLWAELRRDGVDVLSLVVGATDTPSLRGSLEKFGVTVDDLAGMTSLAEPADVREGLAHLGEGPTWQVGVADGAGPSLLGTLPRRQAVELVTQGHDALFRD